jgi:type IV pilus assembly protein PilN
MLHKVNLLDWRTAQRRQQQWATIGLAMLLLLLFILIQTAMFTVVNSRGKKLNEEQTRLIIPRTQLEQRFTQVKLALKEIESLKHFLTNKQRLDSYRLRVFQLEQLIVTTIPDSIYLDKIALNQLSVTVEGVTLQADAIADFIETLQASPLIGEVKIRTVLPASNRWMESYQYFSLTFAFADKTLVDRVGNNDDS